MDKAAIAKAPSNEKLRDQVAIITGGGRGIGRATNREPITVTGFQLRET